MYLYYLFIFAYNFIFEIVIARRRIIIQAYIGLILFMNIIKMMENITTIILIVYIIIINI